MITLARNVGHLIKKCQLPAVVTLLPLMATLPAQADPRSDAVDKIFAHWNSSETPGGNVLILENGHTLYAHSYGMADIELPRKNAPDLLYPIGSVSKQFTGYCIALLVADGKLALSDDIRRYLPEMHDFGTPITIAMLLSHTSGIRDNVNLLILKGRRIDDVTSEKDSFDVIVDQKGLNYKPGTVYRYSNANFVVLAKIVERVSGLSFDEFLKQRVFKPLGLSASRLVTEPVSPVSGVAKGYAGATHIPQPRADSTYGSNGILSTMADLGHWSENFYGKGSSPAFAAMKQLGALSDGLPITYNFGLHHESFHGLPYIEHTGAVAGFHTDILVFPEQRISVILQANTDEFDPAEMAFAVASVYLKEQFVEPSLPKAAAVSPSADVLRRYAGTYETISGTSQIGPGRQYRFSLDGGALHLGGETAALTAASNEEFYSAVTGFHVTFRPAPGGSWVAIVHDRSGTDFAARPVLQQPSVSQAPIPPEKLPGLYYSDELNVAYRLEARGERLLLDVPRGELELRAQGNNRFMVMGDFNAGTFVGTISLTSSGRDPDGFDLTMQGGRVANVHFIRLSTNSGQPTR